MYATAAPGKSAPILHRELVKSARMLFKFASFLANVWQEVRFAIVTVNYRNKVKHMHQPSRSRRRDPPSRCYGIVNNKLY